MRHGIILALAALLPLAVSAACGDAPDGGERTEALERTDVLAEAGEAGDLVVYKSPTCGCCSGWVEHMQEHGFDVDAVDLVQAADLNARRVEHGVPGGLAACHTATVAGYTVEGHVPAEVVARLLRERPDDIEGLAVPGMPVGSPGMEGPNPERYDVIAFDSDGNTRVYATIDPGSR